MRADQERIAESTSERIENQRENEIDPHRRRAHPKARAFCQTPPASSDPNTVFRNGKRASVDYGTNVGLTPSLCYYWLWNVLPGSRPQISLGHFRRARRPGPRRANAQKGHRIRP